MAAAATTAAALSTTLSSLSLHHHRHYNDSSLLSSLHPSFTPKHPQKPLFLRLKFTPVKANSSDIDTSIFDTDPQEISSFTSPERPDDFIDPTPFHELPMESEEEIARAYEELYGPAYSGVSYLGNDVYVMDSEMKHVTGLRAGVRKERVKDGLEERVVQVRRVNKVVKGGKQLNFRVVVVIGDRQGNVGVGVAKAKEVTEAVEKSCIDARRNIVRVPMTRHKTFPHRVEVKYGAAKVMLRPARPGTGVIAGGPVRIILEMAGVENALGKQLGSDNTLNNARATVLAVQQMRLFDEVAALRGIPVQEMWK